MSSENLSPEEEDDPKLNAKLDDEKMVEIQKSKSFLKQILTDKILESQNLELIKNNIESFNENLHNPSQCPSVVKSLEDEEQLGQIKSIFGEVRRRIINADVSQFKSLSSTLATNLQPYPSNSNSVIVFNSLNNNQESKNGNAENFHENYFLANDSSSNDGQQLSSNSYLNEIQSDCSEREFRENKMDNFSISDSELTSLSVRQFNRKIHSLPLDIQLKMRKRRRTLKNRRYATHCRHRRQKHKEALESSNNQLESEIHRCKLELLQVMKEVADLHDHNETLVKEIEGMKKENDSLVQDLNGIDFDDMEIEKN